MGLGAHGLEVQSNTAVKALMLVFEGPQVSCDREIEFKLEFVSNSHLVSKRDVATIVQLCTELDGSKRTIVASAWAQLRPYTLIFV